MSDDYLKFFLPRLRNEIIKEVDDDRVQTIIEIQIKLMSGNKLLYERMHKNLKEHKFESLFAKEQTMLYEFRKSFFYKLCGRRPSFIDFTTPYHITKNFEVVMAMVCSTSDLLKRKCLVEYFEERNFEESNNAVFRFDREDVVAIAVDRKWSIRYGLGFNDAAQMIMAVHRVGPCSLFESALKATVINDLSLEEVPKEIQKKASHGLYQLEDDIPQNLTSEGKVLFGKLKAEYEEEIELK